MSKRPSYALENIVGASVAIEDVFMKAFFRSLQVDLPISDGLQNFYYNHTGDYMNGYLGAFWTNIVLTVGSKKLYAWSQNNLNENNLIRKFAEKIQNKHGLFNFISGLISSAVILIEETQGYLSVPDIKDIPMGIAGAVTHMGLRYLSINRYKNKKSWKIDHCDFTFA